MPAPEPLAPFLEPLERLGLHAEWRKCQGNAR
jgi:hypothetical protein